MSESQLSTEQGLTNIYLGGKLGTTFGKHWKLRVNSVAEAIRAIDVNVKGRLCKYLYAQGNKKFYKIAVGKKTALLDLKEISNRSGQSSIYIMPTVKGRNGGWGKIGAAIAIAVATYFGAPWLGSTFSLQASTVAQISQIGYTLAASLALGGITQLLTPTPNNQPSVGSNLFNGNAASVEQGAAVGIVYGRALVSPTPICISFNNYDQGTSTAPLVTQPISQGGNEYTIVPLVGGGYQYIPNNPDDGQGGAP